MGYGIKLLSSTIYCEETKKLMESVGDDLFRLSGWVIDFIMSCDTLFNICEIDKDEGGDCWDNIYVWKHKYCQLEWKEMKLIIELLIGEFSKNYKYGKLEKVELDDIITTLEKLFSVLDGTRTFKIC